MCTSRRGYTVPPRHCKHWRAHTGKAIGANQCRSRLVRSESAVHGRRGERQGRRTTDVDTEAVHMYTWYVDRCDVIHVNGPT